MYCHFNNHQASNKLICMRRYPSYKYYLITLSDFFIIALSHLKNVLLKP